MDGIVGGEVGSGGVGVESFGSILLFILNGFQLVTSIG